jgi:uncharacterized protein (TIGR04255 family)
MSVGLDLPALEKPARECFRPQYPKFRSQFLEEHHFESKADVLKHSTKRIIQALQFLKDDEKQLMQVRRQGFSFNRLAPYSSLDDYLAEIRNSWHLFQGIVAPAEIRAVRLRYINQIMLDFPSKNIDLDAYFRVGPKLPDENNMRFAGFVNQHTAIEESTGYQVFTVLASQIQENDKLPIIFDICVTSIKTAESVNWNWILSEIQSLRSLKNRIFRNTLTETCLNLYR